MRRRATSHVPVARFAAFACVVLLAPLASLTLGCPRAAPTPPAPAEGENAGAQSGMNIHSVLPQRVDAADSSGPSASSAPSSIAARPEWTLATTLKDPPYAVPKGVANVVAHVPAGWDSAKKIDLVIFFHGAVQCAAQLAQLGEVICKPGDAPLGGYGYDARHDEAATNTLFAVPQFAFFGGGSAGKMIQKEYFPRFVSELVSETFVPGTGSPRTLDDVASITLIGHSAGFNPVIAILSRDELAAKVKNVVLLDAMFAGGEDYYTSWFAKRTADAPRKFVAVYGDSGDGGHHHQNVAKRLEKQLGDDADRVAYLPKGSLVEAIRAHDVTVAQLPINHYWMPTMLLSKVIAGLDLPTRPVPFPRLVGAPPAKVELTLDAKIAGALDEGDALLDDGALADEYAITLAAGDAITITTIGGKSLTETCCTVDVLTQVFDGEELLASDDDGAGSFDSRVLFTAPSAKSYRVRVTTSGTGPRRGPYVIGLTRAK
jgi:hypothetical protein